MNIPLDISRLILLLSRINDIKSLYFVDKLHNNLCHERELWIAKFKENNLNVINLQINSLHEYVSEYNKLSRATYNTNCLINMIKTHHYSIAYDIIWVPQLLIDDIILIKDHPTFVNIKEIPCDIKRYISIDIRFGNESVIDYHLHDTPDEYNEGTKILIEKYNNVNLLLPLITKILYHYPSVKIHDVNFCPIIVLTDDYLDSEFFDNYDKKTIGRRKEYWDECYSKYKELYF